MAFCQNCGAQVSDSVKFCISCGYALAQAQTAARPVAAPQQPQVPPYIQQPQYHQPAPVAARKKKSKLPIVLPIVGAALVGLALLVIFVILPGAMNTMAERDFYTVANNDVPTVKYILGEKRAVTGVSASTRSDGVQEQIVTYKSGEGENTRQDMLAYATALCDEYGFYAINDNDFSGMTGKDFQFAKESTIAGNLVVVQIGYDPGGFTISLRHGPGTIDVPEDSGADTSDLTGDAENTDSPEPTGDGTATDPWVGLWRFEDSGSVELICLYDDGTAEAGVFYKDSSADDFTFSGEYTVSDDMLLITNLSSNGERSDGEATFTFEIRGDTATIDGNDYSRVPEQDAAAVASDPLAPYPAGSGGTEN